MKHNPLLAFVLFSLACAPSLSAADQQPADQAGVRPAEASFLRAAATTLREMKEQAESRKMSGAAVVAFIPGDKATAWVSRMQVVGSFVLGKSNVLGVAYTKAAEMADTLQNSGGGSRGPYKGEFGYKGGVIQKTSSGYLLAVFSGGKSEDDVAVAQAGLAKLVKEMGDEAASK